MTNTTNTAFATYDTKQDYSTHTAHFPKAKKYTYNYTPTDISLIEGYVDHTAQFIADTLREPVNRIRYRASKLITDGAITNKYDVSETAKEIRRLRAELKTVKAQLKATRPSLDKVA